MLIECEYDPEITINSGYGKKDNLLIAEALLKLLNQKYTYKPNDFATL